MSIFQCHNIHVYSTSITITLLLSGELTDTDSEEEEVIVCDDESPLSPEANPQGNILLQLSSIKTF